MTYRRITTPIFAWIITLYILASIVIGIALAELSLRLHKLPLRNVAAHRAYIYDHFHVPVEDVSLTAADGAILKAWFVQPERSNGRSVIILHGITANRIDSTGFAEIFLNRGYAVLMPDSREHGESGGLIATYGILERNDVSLWTRWLRQRDKGCTYLLGESMGAAIGLQATTVAPDLCAVAVESPYSTFRAISYERLGRGTHSGTFFWRTLGRPAIETAIVYTYLKYGIYLPDANPEAAVERSNVPSLLIAGTADRNIPMHHAEELESACPNHCALWIVPHADHGGASSVAHSEFERRILDWFQSHDTSSLP